MKSRAAEFNVDRCDRTEKSDIHVHVPAGAIPKDGPSAGVAMFMALTSLLTGRTVRSDTAMTGEIRLRGLVLPIGGIKEKVLAAIQAGIATVMLPARNRKDIEDVPEKARSRFASSGLSALTTRSRPPSIPRRPRSRTCPARRVRRRRKDGWRVPDSRRDRRDAGSASRI